MNESNRQIMTKKLSPAILVTAIGVVFGAIGTSPLYLMKVVLSGARGPIDNLLVYGTLSGIFWTLTILGTVKYLVLTLQADNKGEGGIFALFALIKKKSDRAALLLITGGSALLVCGIIAPAITLTSSVEGVKLINETLPVIPAVVVLFFLFFLFQRYKPDFISYSYGFVMIIWYLMIGLTGLFEIIQFPQIISALNPVYAVKFIGQYPGGVILMGAVFLCTAGAESIYQELGRFGRVNIRVSWAVVKTILLLNYFGQGAWILSKSVEDSSLNPFFGIMPAWFIIPGIIISVMAALIVSQAIINRSFTLVSEAVSLSFWPNIKIIHPTLIKGQVYLPLINWLFWLTSSLFVIIIRNPVEMTSAYGLVVIITMITSTFLLSYYFLRHKMILGKWLFILPVLAAVELFFLAAVIFSFNNSIWFSVLLTMIFIMIMGGWYFGRKIKNRYISFANLSDYTTLLTELHSDKSVPIIATNLVYIIKASRIDQVESKVIYSILQRQPKRAETYWFLHIDRVDEPDRFDYEFTPVIPGVLHRVDFHIGFKVEPKINLYFREVLEDLVNSGEITLTSSFDSLKKYNFTGDFKYILIDRVMLRDNNLSAIENFILTLHNFTRLLDITDEKALHLDLTNTIVEKIPITIAQPMAHRITRVW